MANPLTTPDVRLLQPALRRAIRCRCPACGGAPLFARFLRPVAACPACGQSWEGHQADDFPAYIVIILLGHLLVPLMIEVNYALSIPLGIQAALWPSLAIILAVALIQPVKACVIALQWAKRMHGFA